MRKYVRPRYQFFILKKWDLESKVFFYFFYNNNIPAENYSPLLYKPAAVFITKFLGFGADINLFGHDSKSAASGQIPKLVQLILDYGGDPTIIDNTGKIANA